MALPPYVQRMAENLEKEELPEVLLMAAVVLENARELFASISFGAVAGEVDAVYKPLIRVLIERSIMLRVPAGFRGGPRGQA